MGSNIIMDNSVDNDIIMNNNSMENSRLNNSMDNNTMDNNNLLRRFSENYCQLKVGESSNKPQYVVT